MCRSAVTAIVPVVSPSPTANAPPATSPSISRSKRPGSPDGTRRLTTVIEPAHRRDVLETVSAFPVRNHVSGAPSQSTWNASSTRPTAKAVGWPRSGGDGANRFKLEVGSTVVAFGLSYPKCARNRSSVASTHSRIGVTRTGTGGGGSSQPCCQIAWPFSLQL